MEKKLSSISENMRRNFTANVSHELKTPITSISGYAEMMMTGLAPSEDLPLLAEKIYTEAQRLIALIDDIINLSRLDEGAVEAPAERVELLSAARHCAERLMDKAAACSVAVEVEGTEETVTGYEQLIDEMITNLCDNAIIQPPRRPRARDRGTAGRGPLHPGGGQRHRHSPGAPRPGVRAVLPRGQEPLQGDGRHGTRPLNS